MLGYSDICEYCIFKEGCEHIKREEVEDCLIWREENEFNNGEE